MNLLADQPVPLWWLLALGAVNVVLLLALLLRPGVNTLRADQAHKHVQLMEQLQAGSARVEQLERALGRDMADASRALRQELMQTMAMFQQTLLSQGAESTRTQNTQIDAFGQQLALLKQNVSDTLTSQLHNAGRVQCRAGCWRCASTLEAQLAQLQASNAARLEEMRATVDEKLQATLQARLGESFRQVAERLEQVHKGLGEMQTLAQGRRRPQAPAEQREDPWHLRRGTTRGAARAGIRGRSVCGPGRHATGQQDGGRFRDPAARARRRRSTACGCRSTPSFPTKTMSACSTPRGEPTRQAPSRRARRWRRGSGTRRVRSRTNTSSRRTPRTSRSCFCPPKACMPRCCVDPA